jgi:hypothetical protein
MKTMNKQWDNGFQAGKEYGEELGMLLGQGECEHKFSKPADRLFLLANALQFPAETGRMKSHVWWSVYACKIAEEMRDVAAQLPSILVCLREQPQSDETTQEIQSAKP